MEVLFGCASAFGVMALFVECRANAADKSCSILSSPESHQRRLGHSISNEGW